MLTNPAMPLARGQHRIRTKGSMSLICWYNKGYFRFLTNAYSPVQQGGGTTDHGAVAEGTWVSLSRAHVGLSLRSLVGRVALVSGSAAGPGNRWTSIYPGASWAAGGRSLPLSAIQRSNDGGVCR